MSFDKLRPLGGRVNKKGLGRRAGSRNGSKARKGLRTALRSA